MKKFLMPFLSLLLIVSVAGNFYLFQQLSKQYNRLALLQQQSSDLTKSAQDLQEQIDDLKNDLSEQQAEKQRLLDEIEKQEQLTSGIDFTFEPTEEMEAMRKEIEAKASSSSASSKGGSESSKVESSSSQVSSSNAQAAPKKDLSSAQFKKPAGGKGQNGSNKDGAKGAKDGNVFAD